MTRTPAAPDPAPPPPTRPNLKVPGPVRFDLPAGGMRFLQDASGYVATLVRGELVRDHDKDTGARPGRLLTNS